jgi:von Willebrand factor type A domain/Aerotolerance regulator N-terminal
MGFGLLNLFMLFGLAAMVIPLVIHLLNRRRFDVVDWGAMQFLQVSEITRRKIFIEELLLMLLRMGLIGLLVLAMAAPWGAGELLEKLNLAENRDVVLVLDGSTGMSFTDDSGKSSQQKAVEWCQDFVDHLVPGDNIAVLQAREQVVPLEAPLTSDHRKVRKLLDKLPDPRGVCNWPQALEAAEQVLRPSHRARREIILLSDKRKAGWSDERTLDRWYGLASQVTGAAKPRLWMVAIDRMDPAQEKAVGNPVPNWSLTPVLAERSRASIGLKFSSALKIQGQKYERPYSLRYRIDRLDAPAPDADEKEQGKALPLPVQDDLRDGRLPLDFTHQFVEPGSHLLTLVVEPDDPAKKRDPVLDKTLIKDRLPADNRQDFAVMLSLLPVLLVDGLAPTPGKYRGADFLQVALAPARDKSRLVRARQVPLEKLVGALDQNIVAEEPNTKPRVLILCDVPSLSSAQRNRIHAFVEAGGGVLVTHGPRSIAKYYNEELYPDDHNFLPARLEEQTGNENEPMSAAHPLPSSFTHPALQLFRDNLSGGLANARFPRWWKLARPVSSGVNDDNNPPPVVVADLTTKSPFLIEKKIGKGRVIQCAAPLDDSWNTNLHRLEVPEFPILAYELAVYLAGSRGIDYNLTPGQPLVYQPLDDESPAQATLQPPFGDRIKLEGKDGFFVSKETLLPGIYTLTTSRQRTVYYVVHADGHGSDNLELSSEADLGRVGEILGLQYTTERSRIVAGEKHDLWWWVLFGVIGLLCCEVWMTRRIVCGRGGH